MVRYYLRERENEGGECLCGKLCRKCGKTCGKTRKTREAQTGKTCGSKCKFRGKTCGSKRLADGGAKLAGKSTELKNKK